MTELRFYVPLDTKIGSFGDIPQANLLAWYNWLGMEKKLSLTQQKHALTNQHNVLQHKINIKN